MAATWKKLAFATDVLANLVEDTTPQLGGDLDLNEFNLQVKEAPASDHAASGIIVTMTYGEALAIGDAVYFKSDGKVWLADANAAGLYPAMGIALAAESSGVHKVLLFGIMRHDAWTWTVGGVIYLSITAGAMTQTQPLATDNVIQVLGIATHADRMFFNPQLDYITHV
jgi:hypothetical protein